MFEDEIVTIPVGSIVVFSNIVCEVRGVLSPDELVLAGYDSNVVAYHLYDMDEDVMYIAADDEIIMLY